jgi:hypothetical protein
LKSGGQAGVVGGSGRWGRFAAGEAQGNGEGGGGHDGARGGDFFGEIFSGVHGLPFSCDVEDYCEHCKSRNGYTMLCLDPKVLPERNGSYVLD